MGAALPSTRIALCSAARIDVTESADMTGADAVCSRTSDPAVPPTSSAACSARAPACTPPLPPRCPPLPPLGRLLSRHRDAGAAPLLHEAELDRALVALDPIGRRQEVHLLPPRVVRRRQRPW